MKGCSLGEVGGGGLGGGPGAGENQGQRNSHTIKGAGEDKTGQEEYPMGPTPDQSSSSTRRATANCKKASNDLVKWGGGARRGKVTYKRFPESKTLKDAKTSSRRKQVGKNEKRKRVGGKTSFRGPGSG